MQTKSKWLVYNLLILAVCLLLSFAVAAVFYNTLRLKTKERVERTNEYFTTRTENAINSIFHKTDVLAAIVRVRNGNLTKEVFDEVAKTVYEKNSGIRGIQAMPGAVVTYSYPVKGNEPVIGKNFFKIPSRVKDVMLAINTKSIALSGPYHLLQGGLGVVARNPVFLKGPGGREYFWGFSTIVLDLPEAIKTAGLERLQTNGNDFQLYSVNELGEKIVIAGDPHLDVQNASLCAVKVPHHEWILAVHYNDYRTDIYKALTLFLAGILLSLGVWMRMRLTIRKQVEAAERSSKQIYEDAVKAAKIVVWEYDIPNRRLVMSDDEFTRTDYAKYGFSNVIEDAPHVLGKYIDAADLPKFMAMYDEVEQGRDASCTVWYKYTPEQEERCERISYTVVRDDDTGHAAKALGIGLNITAEEKGRKRYEQELKSMSECNDRNLVAKGHYNLTRNLILEYITTSGTYSVEPGTSYDDAYDLFVSLPYREADRSMVAEKLNRLNLIEKYRNGDSRTSLQYMRIVDDGAPIWISVAIVTHIMPDTGDIECFTYSYDITDNIQNDFIIGLISDTQFDYIALIYVSTSMFEFLKKSSHIEFPDVRQKVAYADCCDYVRKNFVGEDEKLQFDAAVSLKNIVAGLRANGRHTAMYYRSENGRTLCKQIDYIWLDKNLEVILAVRSDTTLSYEREQEQIKLIREAKFAADKANEAKSTFLSSMSHDLRTPLNGIIGFTDIAIRTEDKDKKQEYLSKIKSSGELLLALVNDTLELSRIESGKMTLEPETTNCEEIGEQVVTALKPSADLKHIAIEFNSQCKHKTFWADKLKMQKVFLNLLSNAIKYTPNGGRIQILIEIIEPPLNGCNYRLTVKDNGIGMSREFLPNIYEPFSQERRPEAANVTGTGLGMAIVKRIIDLIHGHIEVRSELGVGTEFTVSVPLQEIEHGRATRLQTEQDNKILAGRRILLCEDNSLNAEIAAILMQEKGLIVDWAQNGKEGLDKFSSSKPGYYDAVLMDIRMPVMDGHEATKAIRNSGRQDAGCIPIIAMTAEAFEEDIRLSKEIGMNGYITKPFDAERIMKALCENIKN